MKKESNSSFDKFKETEVGKKLHELKNSLSAAIGYLNLLKMKVKFTEESEEFIKNIELALSDAIEKSYQLTDLVQKSVLFSEGISSTLPLPEDAPFFSDNDLEEEESQTNWESEIPNPKAEVEIPTSPINAIEFIISDEFKNPFSDEDEEEIELSENPPPPTKARSARLLVVEDDQAYKNLLKSFFVQLGYQLEFASDGERALELCQESEFDLILLDYELPQYSGRELAQKIREVRPETKIILLSGYPPELLLTDPEIRAIKFDEIVGKPIVLSKLHQIIQRVLAS